MAEKIDMFDEVKVGEKVFVGRSTYGGHEWAAEHPGVVIKVDPASHLRVTALLTIRSMVQDRVAIVDADNCIRINRKEFNAMAGADGYSQERIAAWLKETYDDLGSTSQVNKQKG